MGSACVLNGGACLLSYLEVISKGVFITVSRTTFFGTIVIYFLHRSAGGGGRRHISSTLPYLREHFLSCHHKTTATTHSGSQDGVSGCINESGLHLLRILFLKKVWVVNKDISLQWLQIIFFLWKPSYACLTLLQAPYSGKEYQRLLSVTLAGCH